MKLIKNVMDKKQLKCSIALLMIIANNNFGMDAQQVSKTKIVLKRRRDDKEEGSRKRPKVESSEMNVEQQGKYFIYQEGTDNGVWVDKQFVKEQCKSLKDMLEDFGGENEPDRIPLQFSVDVIKLGFDVLQRKINIDQLNFNQLASVVNIFNFLDVSQEVVNQVLNKLRQFIQMYGEQVINHEAFKQLNPDIQKVLLINIIESSVKKSAAEKINDRKKIIEDNKTSYVSPIIFSSDNKKVLYDSFVENETVLGELDISNWNNTSYKPLLKKSFLKRTLAISPDGRKIISKSNSADFILWDISDLQNIKKRTLSCNSEIIQNVIFSPDNNKIIIVAGYERNNLWLWDISDWNNIKSQSLIDNTAIINGVAFSPDNKMIISGIITLMNQEKELILWDITDFNNIKNKILENNFESNITSIAFSPNGTKIAFVLGKSNLMLWDIRDLNNIKRYSLSDKMNVEKMNINALAFSPDGTKIISAGLMLTGKESDQKKNLILWDISDLSDIKYQFLFGFLDTRLVVFSPDSIKIAASGPYRKILWELLTNDENQLLQQMHNYTVDQIRLIYILLQRQSLKFKSNDEINIFKSLPEYAKKVLNDMLRH